MKYKVDNPVAPMLEEVTLRGLTCVIHTPNKEDAICVVGKIPSSSHSTTSNEWLEYWDRYKANTCYYIVDGAIDSYSEKSYFENNSDLRSGIPYTIYEFSDLFATGGFCDGFRGGKIPTPEKPISIEEQLGLPKGVSIHDLPTSEWYRHFTVVKDEIDALKHMANNVCVRADITDFDAQRFKKRLADISTRLKEEKNLKFTFYFNVNEGTRVDKSCNGTIPTITTSVVLDKFGDPNRRNCYSLEGEATCDKADYDMRQGVLEALANAIFDGNFEKAYDKAVKTNAFCERQDRTCHYCGKVLDTIEEKQAHEAWHVERKKARRERYLLRKRAKEIAFEEQAQKMAKEMIEK